MLVNHAPLIERPDTDFIRKRILLNNFPLILNPMSVLNINRHRIFRITFIDQKVKLGMLMELVGMNRRNDFFIIYSLLIHEPICFITRYIITSDFFVMREKIIR